MRSIVNDQGTAMAEATLCEEHYKQHEPPIVAEAAAENAEDFAGFNWQDSTGNDAVSCIWCGKEGD